MEGHISRISRDVKRRMASVEKRETEERRRITESREDDSETASAPESGRWEFDEDVTASFEDMIRRSIPNYGDMRRMVADAALWLSSRESVTLPHIVDLGCSRGEALASVRDRAEGQGWTFTGLEISPPMLAAARERFDGAEDTRIIEADLREGLPASVCRVGTGGVSHPVAVLSVLTLQFVPIEYRQRLLRQTYQALRGGGGLILVEKVLGEGAEMDEMEVDLYYELKRGNGYSQEAIDRKRLSLEGALVPVTARMNEEFLRGAGFQAVDCVWSWMNFRGWVALK